MCVEEKVHEDECWIKLPQGWIQCAVSCEHDNEASNSIIVGECFDKLSHNHILK
jgi:hypothetical protein